MTRLPDLSQGLQSWLGWLVCFALGLVMMRFGTKVFRDCNAVSHQYPWAWEADQIRFLEGGRAFIGFALLITWLVFCVAQPSLSVAVPFGSAEALLIVALLLLTNAWILLVVPRNWSASVIARLRFDRAMACLILWWAILLGCTLFAIVRAAPPLAERPVHVFGTYA